MSDIYRLRFHLMPPKGWLNDPNGLCQKDGMYHVYFQYSKDNPQGGNKAWGHYMGENLINMRYDSEVLKPDCVFDADGVYSGSALVWQNGIHVFYTGNVKASGNYDYVLKGRQSNTIHVVSEDGITFGAKEVVLSTEDYPVYYSCHIRDPKVWHEITENGNDVFYMVLGGRTKKDNGQVLLYKSLDLKKWHFVRDIKTDYEFGYMWECPDYFKLDKKSFLSVSPQGLVAEEFRYQNIYQSGYFNMEGSIEEGKLLEFTEWDMGFDFYAPQTFEDSLGRRILIGWAGIPDASYDNKPTVDMGWQHALTVPRTLVYNENVGKLIQWPVSEIEEFRETPYKFMEDTIIKGYEVFDLELTCKDQEDNRCKILITADSPMGDEVASATGSLAGVGNEGIRLTYENGIFALTFTGNIGRGRTTRKIPIDKLQDIRILADTSLVEIYINHGEYVMTSRFYFTKATRWISTEGIEEGCIWNVKAATLE